MSRVNHSRHVLLVGRTDMDSWLQRFASVLSGFAETTRVGQCDAENLFIQHNYDIVMIDDACLDDSYTLLQTITHLQPAIRVVVVDNKQPDHTKWQRARLAFQNGAADYIPGSFNPEELEQVIKEI
jgi:DNA-binding NtrC family response regulator